ncbi:MAG: sulfatase-like hydrolase/transferase [Planctomycetota bacterium]|nr:sulfatase-like hydrolase/transferase [Planctomycetota bacterium]
MKTILIFLFVLLPVCHGFAGDNPPNVVTLPADDLGCYGAPVNTPIADKNAAGTGKRKPPNVVILLADDLGSKDIGCYGGPVKTPVLDKLAAGGVKFTNFYSAAPVCSPARASLLTGRHHLRTGVYTVIQDHMHDMHLKLEEFTIAEMLKTKGYETAHVGKWHLGTPFRGKTKPWIDEQGFDHWFATDLNAAPSHHNPTNFWRNREKVGALKGYACQIVADEAITWLDKNRNPEKPFFLNIWFHEPHAPLAAPPELIREYGGVNEQEAIYSATIDNTDRAIGRLVQHLKAIGEFDNTLIIYTSDHGSYRHERNGNLRAGKGSMFEGGIRTPCIFHWPDGIEGGQIAGVPGGSIDIFPTIGGIVEAEYPPGLHLDGTDLGPLLTGSQEALKRRQPLTWHSPLSNPVAVIREGDYTLMGFRQEEFPKDNKAIQAVMEEMAVHLEKHVGKKLTGRELWHECYNNPLATVEYKKLRGEFVNLNSFQERWTQMIKSGVGGISRVELFNLSSDPTQQKDLSKALPELTNRLEKSLVSIHQEIIREAPIWGDDDMKIGMNGIDSPFPIRLHTTFDAFAYVNRIPTFPGKDETQDSLAQRILSRLANQEGRILVKLPPEMNHYTYNGFKLAVEGVDSTTSGRCIRCHHLPGFASKSEDGSDIPSLRNKSYSLPRLETLLQNQTHQHIKLNKTQRIELLALIYSLKDLPAEQYRQAILESTVLDTSGDGRK